MPAITIQSLELRKEQKEVLAEKFIEIFSEITNVPQDRIYIFFDGYELEDTATGGKLFSDIKPKTIIAKFNEEK